MNFLLIGHSVVDKIIDNNIISIKPGGIFYTVAAFLSQLKNDDKIFLCTEIDEANEHLFKDYYNRVEKKYINFADTIPMVELTIDNIGERKETYSRITNELKLPSSNFNNFEGILINMITGYDISLNQLETLRKNYRGIIYFDVHTLSRGVDENLRRNFRKIPEFSNWAACIDILQANESELLTLSEEVDAEEIIENLLSLGVMQIIITQAEKGATVYFTENGIAKKVHRDALKINLVNKVGCGDVFGAVYFYNYIKNKNVTLAIEQANLFAGIASTYLQAKDYLNLKIDADKQDGKK